MAYTRVNWEDLPSTNTPINAENLNKMDKGIYDNAFESGSNQYGSYIKFNDGTLIQWGEDIFGTSGTSSDSYKSVTFPISFIDNTYSMFAQVRYASGISQSYSLGTILTPSVGSTTYNDIYRRLSYLLPTDSGQSALYSIALPFYWYAIGCWK